MGKMRKKLKLNKFMIEPVNNDAEEKREKMTLLHFNLN